MKKLPLLALALLSFCSCSKDDETPDNELVGTVWRAHLLEWEKYTPITRDDRLEFLSNESVQFHSIKTRNVTDTIWDWTNTIKYEFDYPDLKIGSSTYKFDNHWQFVSLENGLTYKIQE